MGKAINFLFGEKKVRFISFWLAISSLYALIFVSAEFAGSPVSGFKGFITLSIHWLIVSVTASALLFLIIVNRYICIVTLPIIFTASSIAAYYKLTLGLSITHTLIELALVNNMATWATVISPSLIALTLLTFIASIGVSIFRLRRVASPTHAVILTLTALAVIAVPIKAIHKLKTPVIARMPFSFIYSIIDYNTNRKIIAQERNTFENTSVEISTDSITVVFVIGESLRADHLQLNGYKRQTTPLLSAEPDVVSIGKIYTEPYFTHSSVPRIITRADSLYPLRAYTEQSFITIFKKAGYSTAWISNQDACATYTYFMHETDTLVQCNSANTLYSYHKWLDTDMLPHFNNLMQGENPRKLIILHTIGSHWWYPSHYPDSMARFKPEVDSRIISEISQEQITNSYDNTIVVTDRFIHSLIERLRNENAVLIFISDHGESLGENGNYLHGADYPELHYPACFFWFSPAYEHLYPDKINALKANAQKEWTTDALFHTVIDAGDIMTSVLIPSQSILRFE